MNALTQTITRNPSQVDDKILAAWDRSVRNHERAEQAFAAALKKAHRISGLYEEAAPPVPDINWPLIGDALNLDDRTISLLYTDIDELTEWARTQGRWTFPHPSDESILLEIAKIREYRLRRDLLDARLGYYKAQEACDDACDRRTDAESKVLLTPAPDLDAVQYKLEYLFGDFETGAKDEHVERWSREYTDALIADVRRLNQQQKGA